MAFKSPQWPEQRKITFCSDDDDYTDDEGDADYVDDECM